MPPELDPRPTLVVEAATYRGSVAIVRGDQVLAADAVPLRGEHTERLLPAVARVLERAGLRVTDLGRVVCGAGPGSFTSLRIGAAIAKGLTGARVASKERPLASVSSLALIVAGRADRLPIGSYVATLDAMRGERYAALVRVAADGTGGAPPPLAVHSLAPWRRLREVEVTAWAGEVGAQVIGPGRAIDAWPEAAGVTRLWPEVSPVDAASWEPDYGRLAEPEVRRLAAIGAQPAP